MRDHWTGCTCVWQTSPFSPADQCDLAFVRVHDSLLVALVVDGAPGRLSARPPWPRETLFAAVSDTFLNHDEPETMLRETGDRLRKAFQGQPWRLFAAAAAMRWNTNTGVIDVAEVGDTKAWLVELSCATPLTDGGIPQPGVTPRNMLGAHAPEVRTRQATFAPDGGPTSRTVALLTDGAYALLTSAMGVLPADIHDWSLQAVGGDDATLLLIQSP